MKIHTYTLRFILNVKQLSFEWILCIVIVNLV